MGNYFSSRSVRGSFFAQRPGDLYNPVQLGPQMFNDIDRFIQDNERSARNFNRGMNVLVQILAKTQQGFAQSLSAGPLDPTRLHPTESWQVPIRRITSRYYYGWQVRKIRNAAWETFNDTREAFFIEYGIHQGTVAIKRPVRKMSLINTLRLAQQSRVYNRIWSDIFDPRLRGAYTTPGGGL